MDLSRPPTSSSDDETRALNALLDAFSCAFSLDDIADAFVRAKGDVKRAGDFLTELQLSLPHINDVERSTETKLSMSDEAVEEKCTGNSSQPRTLSQIEKASEEKSTENSDQTRMPEKLQKSSASFGSVSSVLGKESAHATTVNRASQKEKPIKLPLPEYMRDDCNLISDESDSVPKRETLHNKDVEEFLFCMLGEGFKLNMEVIRGVLDSCGYDIKKSMEELMSFSEKGLDKKAESKCNVMQDVTVKSSSSKGSCLGSQSSSSAHSEQEEKRSSRPQISPGELLEAIFTVPGRLEEEPKGRRYESGANRSRVPDQKPVLKPLEDVSSYSTDLPVKIVLSSKESALDDEDYRNYRRAAKQNWDMMKQYYEKAVDAFRKGNQKEVDYLIQEGKNCYRMARLADEKSAGEIIKSKKPESISEVALDLTSVDAANVPNLLRLHLKKLANIPSFEYLRVIIGVDDGSFKMGQKWRKAMKYLEKYSIEWSQEEPNSGSILVRINQASRQG